MELDPSDEKAKDRIKELGKTLGIKPEPTIEESVEAILKNAEIPTAKPAPPSVKAEEKFEEKLTEADFYAQQGLKEEAIKIYEELLSIAPDNNEIRKKLRALKSEERLEVKLSLPEEEMPTPTATEAELMGVFDKFKKEFSSLFLIEWLEIDNNDVVNTAAHQTLYAKLLNNKNFL